MPLIRGGPASPGYVRLAGPGDSELSYLEFGLLNLSDGQSWERALADQEAVLVVLSGRCDVAVGGTAWANIGGRAEVFDGKPAVVYAPPKSSLSVTGRGPVEVALCCSRAERGGEPKLISPDQVAVRTAGRGTYRREIYDLATPDNLTAQRILVGETFNPPGLWSSYPPHKHDTEDLPAESKLEEVYHFRLKPQQGFGFQRVYGDGFDEGYAVQDRDTVIITKGFHPVGAAPGYELYYLWMLAGEKRVMHPREDPAHSWVQEQA